MAFGQQDTLLELLDERSRLEIEAGQIKGRLTQTNQKIIALVKSSVDLALTRVGKVDGTIRFMFGNQFFKAVIGKRIEWNSDALKDIEKEISPALADNLFKKVYSVPDVNFRAVLDPTLKAKLTIARTVKYDDPKITLETEDA